MLKAKTSLSGTNTLGRGLRLRFISVLLGLRGREESWEGLPRQWAFTNFRPGPLEGRTFYLPAGASFGQVRRRWREKRNEGAGDEGPVISNQ